ACRVQRPRQCVGGEGDRDGFAVGLAVRATHQAARRLQELRRLGQHLRRQLAQVVAGLPVLLAHVAPPRVPALAVLRGQMIVPGLRSLVPRRRAGYRLAVAVLRRSEERRVGKEGRARGSPYAVETNTSNTEIA